MAFNFFACEANCVQVLQNEKQQRLNLELSVHWIIVLIQATKEMVRSDFYVNTNSSHQTIVDGERKQDSLFIQDMYPCSFKFYVSTFEE